jgi:chromosome segregation protein
LDENAGSAEHVERLESALEKISQAVNESTSKLSVIENDKAECSGSVDEAYRVVQEISSKLTRLEAETESLSAMLSANIDMEQTPIVDLIDVNEGYEKALSTALGDDLTAPIRMGDSITGKRFWTDNTSKHKGSKLPEGVEALADQVKVPAILEDRINQIGIAYDAATAMRLQKELVQGQCLTTVDGGLWRWDGYVTEPGIVSSAQIRIQQQNRVKEIERNTEILTAEQINASD